jgi:oxygen-independent coproporphyrinogen-3 oxidase
MLGLYVHVPFCSSICNYCNFNRGLFDDALKARYVEALLTEISRLSGHRGLPADTIYFGGGTPSLLEADEIARIVEACRTSFSIAADPEITLEVNPETASVTHLRACRAAGVNRLSFGVQSFRDEELRRLSRLHGAERACAAFEEARSAGFDNVSLDLMMWLPEQRVDQWLESVDRAIELGPEHLSLYLLELYPNAPLKDEMARSAWSQAPDEDAAAMYTGAMERLEASGLSQYELSNVARPGREARHNLKYWTDGAWLGFGCGAHSTFDGTRWKNCSETDQYVGRVAAGLSPATEVRALTAAERLGDALFTGLRLTNGVDLDRIRERYGVDVLERYGDALQPFVAEGLLLQDDGRLWLTRRGMLLAHEVMAVFV